MADENIQRLHERLVNNEEDLETFKNDPEPILQEHGVSLEPGQVDKLKQRMASMDTPTLKATLQTEGLHSMV
jgi:hypothetical protein